VCRLPIEPQARKKWNEIYLPQQNYQMLQQKSALAGRRHQQDFENKSSPIKVFAAMTKIDSCVSP
jgi:hypothetical protein